MSEERLKEMIEPLGSWENIYIYKGNRSCGKSYIQSLLDDKDKEIERLTNIIEKAVEYIEKLSPCMSDDEGGTLYMTSTIWGEDLLNILNGRSDE